MHNQTHNQERVSGSRQPRTIFRIYFRRRPNQNQTDSALLWRGTQPTLLVTGRDELERILGRKTPIAVAWEKAKLHRCSTCDRRGAWEAGWEWRGDWKAIDNGEPIEIRCSSCRPEGERDWRWRDYEPLPQRERTKRFEISMSDHERQKLQRDRRTVPLFPDWKGVGWCRWCGDKIEHKRAKQMNWHPGCKRVWLLHYDRDVQMRFLIQRDGNDCWDCRRGGRWHRIDLVVPRYHWEGLAGCYPGKVDWNARYPDDLAQRKVEGVIVGLYTKVEYRRSCGGLEVDHEIPLWSIWHLPDEERKRFYGPENLRLRCGACHKAKSAREAAERARLKAKGPIDLDAS